jgi:hypothetical protein
MNAQAEIAYLERLYALPSGRENMEMENNSSINRLAAAVLNDMERAAARVGTDGPWCYFCGADGPTKACACDHPENFGCHRKRVCSGCESAMEAVARHIKAICREKRVNRVSSVRQKFYFQLTRAARCAGNGELHEPSELHFCLSAADPLDDEPDDFRMKLLGAFVRSGFLRFQQLANELARETDAALFRSVIRAFGADTGALRKA